MAESWRQIIKIWIINRQLHAARAAILALYHMLVREEINIAIIVLSLFFFAASLLTVIIFMQIVLKTEAEAESFALQASRCGIQQRGESEKAEKTLPEMKFLQHGNEHYF